MTNRAYVISGAVIVSDDGYRVKFHPQCPKCGTVEENTTGVGEVRYGTAQVGSFFCHKYGCGESFIVKIGRN